MFFPDYAPGVGGFPETDAVIGDGVEYYDVQGADWLIDTANFYEDNGNIYFDLAMIFDVEGFEEDLLIGGRTGWGWDRKTWTLLI